MDLRIVDDFTAANALANLSEPAKQIIEQVDRQLQATGKMCTYSDFLEMLAASKKLTSFDRLNLFTLFGRIQKPPLSTTELHDLLRAQQGSLPMLLVTYTVEHLVSPPVNDQREEGHVVESCAFAMQYPKLMFDKTITIDGVFQERSIEAYDGEVIRGKVSRPDSMEFVSVQQLDTRSRFFEDTNPLLAAMFLNFNEHESGLMFQQQYDAALLAQSTFLYESQATISGYRCFVIGNEQLQAFIAPELGYAVVEIRRGGLDVNPAGEYVKSPNYSTVANSDFQKISDGVWLPGRSERISIRHKEVYSHSVTTVKSYEYKPEYPEKLFAGEIPDGAYVADVVNKVSYLAGSDDIGDRLSEGVESQYIGPLRRWWLLVANGLALAALILVVAYRKWSRKA